MPAPSQEGYVEAVLRVVEAVPAGQVVAYSDIAELLGRGGPRQVGQVMAREGAAVPWWRVVHADGRLVRGLEAQSLPLLRAEGTPLRGDRVDIGRARCDLGRLAETVGFPSGSDV